jgi:hypothetical protein
VTSLVFSGQGSANTTPFAIGGQGRWKVAWSRLRRPGARLRHPPDPGPGRGRRLTVTRTSAWLPRWPGPIATPASTPCASGPRALAPGRHQLLLTTATSGSRCPAAG